MRPPRELKAGRSVTVIAAGDKRHGGASRLPCSDPALFSTLRRMGSARLAVGGALCAILWMGCFPRNGTIPLEPYSVGGMLVGDVNATGVSAFGATDGGYTDFPPVASTGLDNRHAFSMEIQGPHAVLIFLGGAQAG
ncbi:MAG TPA: hypothetical protein VFH51_20050, partial [Myxococcota bacterium]|nr:hypothetical protein [Myxococcota bacterium]